MMNKRLISLAVCFVSLSGCADLGSNYQPILDGQPDPIYQSDLQSCQELARSQSFDEDTAGAVIAGGLFGSLVGDYESGVSSMQGTIAGAFFGLIGATFDGVDQRKSIVIECMQGRGHRVVG
jgi:hypothetical protein